MVFGSKGCGKTSLLHALVGQVPASSGEGDDLRGDYTAVGTVTLPPTTEKTLVLKEMGLEATKQLLSEQEGGLGFNEYDVAAFLFDSSDPRSFHEIQKLMLQVRTFGLKPKDDS